MSQKPAGDDQPAVDKTDLHISPASTPLEVPVFNCVVYVAQGTDGRVRARVANLADLRCDAASEREALAKLVPAFKQRISAWTAESTPIPWIDPPVAAEAGEQSRFIPVHL